MPNDSCDCVSPEPTEWTVEFALTDGRWCCCEDCNADAECTVTALDD